MKVIYEGKANRHDLVHVTCEHCGTNVVFWRGEPGTVLDYIKSNDDTARFRAQWKCPICGVDETVYVNHIDPIYDYICGLIDGVEKDRVLTVEEKADLEAVMMKTEK